MKTSSAKENSVKAKKSLGQHFLKSQGAIKAIVLSGQLQKDDVVLEIGPGTGALTKELLAHAGRVIAIEKDESLVELLQEESKKWHKEENDKPNNLGQLDLIQADILNFDPQSLSSKTKSYKLIANIPYYITGAIIRRFLETSFPPSTMVLLVQKEVAERIAVKNSGKNLAKESLLSISVKAYGQPKIVVKVPRGAFVPVPNVDSAVLLVQNISKIRFQEAKITEKSFFQLLHAAFAHKRKKLIGNLSLLEADLNKRVSIFEKAGISVNIRAEDVNLETWFILTSLF